MVKLYICEQLKTAGKKAPVNSEAKIKLFIIETLITL